MKKGIIIAVIISMITQSTYAAVTINENADTKIMTVSGTMEGTELTNLVSFDIEDSQGKNIYRSFIDTKNGEFSYDFILADETPTGRYTLIFNSYGLETPEKIEIDYVSVNETTAIISSLNSAADSAAVVEVMDVHGEALGISQRWYSLLSDNDKIVIADVILAGKGEGYNNNDIRKIKEDVRVTLAPMAFMASETETDIETALLQFEDIYDIENNTVLSEKYDAFSNEATTYARKLMSENKDNITDIYTLFDSSVLLTYISVAGQPLDIINIIETNRNLITFDLSTFDISNKSATAHYLYGKTFETMSDLQTGIINAYQAQTTPVQSGGSSSGGGKNSSSSAIINVPVPKNSDVAVIENADIFTDLQNAEWAKTAINYLANEKIVTGVSDNKFEPFAEVTREQFAVMLVKAFELADNNAEADFADVNSQHWAYNAIASAYKAGVINGIGEGKFGLGMKIKRQDIAVMVKAAADKCGFNLDGNNVLDLTDIDSLPEYARESVEVMVKAGIINGFAEDNTFRGSDTATRAQAAQIIYTVLQRKDG